MTRPDETPRRRRTLWDRYVRRFGWWAKPLLVTGSLAVGGSGVKLASAVLATPGKVEALTARVDTLAQHQLAQGDDLKEVSEATWTFVALRCLELDDSAFVSSRLPCGKAFIISGVVRRISR